jgi:hypothetical protein
VRARQNEIVSTPANVAEIVNLDAVTLSRAIRSEQVSCVEVMNAYLDQIERLNPRVDAIVSLQPREDLLGQARTRDTQLARGEYLGRMHGFPHACKDLEPTRGIRTTMGSPLFKNFVPRDDSILVERIRRAGAIIIGKTNVPEFGLGSQTYNTVFGTTLNAYDQSKTCGGSSGGAAVALALRMLPVADGSDNGGSLRNPAVWNNVFGLRTSFGRVPSLFNEVFIPTISVAWPDGADGARPCDAAVGDCRIRRARRFRFGRIRRSSHGHSRATSKARGSDGSVTSADTFRSIRACLSSAKTRSRCSSRSDASWRPRRPTIRSSLCGIAGARSGHGR